MPRGGAKHATNYWAKRKNDSKKENRSSAKKFKEETLKKLSIATSAPQYGGKREPLEERTQRQVLILAASLLPQVDIGLACGISMHAAPGQKRSESGLCAPLHGGKQPKPLLPRASRCLATTRT
jgi:hypothetical protein